MKKGPSRINLLNWIQFAIGMAASLSIVTVTHAADELTPQEATQMLERGGAEVSRYSVVFKEIESPSVETMEALAALRKITTVVIIGKDADKILTRIPMMPNLETLSVYGEVDEDGVRRVGQLKSLKRLRIKGAGMNDERLLLLGEMENLATLKLSRDAVTRAGIEAILEKLPNLTVTVD